MGLNLKTNTTQNGTVHVKVALLRVRSPDMFLAAAHFVTLSQCLQAVGMLANYNSHLLTL